MHRQISTQFVRPSFTPGRKYLAAYLLQPATRNIRYPARSQYIYESFPPSRTQRSYYATMAIELAPLPLPPSADPSKFSEFGREVKGINPGTLTAEQFKEIEEHETTV